MSPPQLADECERMLAQFVERSPYPDARVAIAFDDADILLDESEPELRGSLRHLATGTMSDHLSFVMTTSDPLALHSEHGDVSSFTNIFHEEYLGLLTPDESRELIERATESLRPNRALLGGLEEDDGARDYDEDESEVTLDEDDAEFLLAHAGRHPDILKVGCRYLLDSKRRGPELQRQLRLLGDANRRTRAFSPEGEAGLAAAKIPERTQMLHAIVARRLRTDGHVRGVYDAIAARLLEELPLYQAAVSIARNNQRPRHERDELDLGAVDWLTIGDLVRIGIVDDTGDRYRLFSTSFEEHLLRRAAPGDRYRLFSTSLEEHLLRRAAPAEGEQSREPEVSELRYIPGRREVAVGDRRLKLTPLESRLMGQLWDNADHICDKSDLLEEIWGPGTSEAVLEKAVNRLRTKINRESEGVDYIMTVRGVGYMLQPHP